MKSANHILAVLERNANDSGLLRKAAGLARQFGAQLELFLCDAEQAYVLKHTYDPQHSDAVRSACLAQARDYLLELQGSVDLHDVRTTVDAACESPLYEGIVHKVLRSRPGLVIKNASQADSPTRAAFDPNDWMLMRGCPATLLMTHGRIWRARPRFAALVDVSGEETVGLAKKILESGERLRGAYGAEFDVLYAERGGFGRDPRDARAAVLQELSEQAHVDAHQTHILSGDPEVVLPTFAREREYDVLIVGALTHRPSAVTLVGTLTSKLVDAIPCDFVLVKPASTPPALEMSTGAEQWHPASAEFQGSTGA